MVSRSDINQERIMAKKKWIQGAVKKPGTLTALAKKAGKSIESYCASAGLSGKAKQKCNFYKNVVKRGK
jgi:hypothetical protein